MPRGDLGQGLPGRGGEGRGRKGPQRGDSGRVHWVLLFKACTFGSASVTVENKRRKYFISLNVVHRYERTLGGLFTRVKMTFKDLM